MAVPYTFGTATAAIPLSQLDSNFSTTITLGNTAIQLGNTVTTLNNMTLANATISSGNVTLTNVTVATANVTTGNITTLAVGSGGIKSAGNVVVGTTDFTSTAVSGAMAVNGYGIYPYVTGGSTNTTIYSGVNWYTPTAYAGDNGATANTLNGFFSTVNIKNTGVGGTAALSGNGYNAFCNVESSGTAARLSLRGVSVTVQRNQAADTSTNGSNVLYGYQTSVAHSNPAPNSIVSTNVLSANFATTNLAGNVTNTLGGVFSSLNTGASATTYTCSSANMINFYQTGFSVGTATGNTATVTTGAAFYGSGPTVGATGTMTTYYGLFLGSASVAGTLTNNWGVYSADTAANNYFGGKVLVGVTSANANGGILQLSSGITFPATQVAATDANTLDDYEEGTWTPNVGGTATYTTQSGFYTKVGRLVTLQCQLTINVIGTGSTTTISGLPFAEGRGQIAPISIGYFASLATTVSFLSGYVGSSATTITFTSTTVAATGMNDAVAIFGSGTRVNLSITYQV